MPPAIKRLNDAGYKVIVVTNQSGIGRGYFTEETLSRIHGKMIRTVEAAGGRIDDVFHCPHTPDDHCSCRKPEVGMGLAAISKHSINPRISFMVGDHEKDMEFGRRLGCRSIQVSESYTFADAVDEILRTCGN